LIDDQIPRGARGDETMTTAAEETAAWLAYEALPGRIIGTQGDTHREARVKPIGKAAGAVGINTNLGYSNTQ
jgi:hypothetical protein